jgi:hypothetical protein
LTGVPFDFRNTKDLVNAVSKFGRLISWDKEDEHMGRIVIKARVMSLDIIPKSMRWSEGDEFEEDGWSSSIEVLASELLGGGPTDEDPIPPDNVDPHPLPENANIAVGFHQAALDNNQMDSQAEDDWEQDGNLDIPQQGNHNAALDDLLDVVQQEEMAWAYGEELLPAISNSSLSSDMSCYEGDNSNFLAPPVTAGIFHFGAHMHAALPPPPVNAIANGLQNIIQAYQSDDDEPQMIQDQNIVIPQQVAGAVNEVVAHD